jgi:hypothetical protein
MVTTYSSLVGFIPENEQTFAQLKTEHTEYDVYVSFFSSVDGMAFIV